MGFRHSKIVCTIGPASRSPKMIDRLLSAGMDVARLNFSHGTHEEHAKNISTLRAAAIEHEKPIAILADLQGPKIRTGPLAGGGPVLLHTGQKFVITTAKVLGDLAFWTRLGVPWRVYDKDDPAVKTNRYDVAASKAGGLPALLVLSEHCDVLKSIKLPATTMDVQKEVIGK